MSRDRRPLVRNAADPRQVARSGRKEHQAEADYLGFLRHVLSTSSGRYVFAKLLLEDGLLYDDIFAESHALMAQREGRRKWALEIRRAILDADPDAFALLEREWYARIDQANFETDASHAAIDQANADDPDQGQ